MATHTSLVSLFSDIADAIRDKNGSSAQLVADEFPTTIANLEAVGMGTVTASPGSSSSLSINFTGLQGEPIMFACIPADFSISDSYSYRRVVFVGYDGTSDMIGASVPKSHAGSSSYYLYPTGNYFSFTYSSGTLTITSVGRTSGGYFANVVYTLIYAY